MRLQEKGWLKRYLQNRREQILASGAGNVRARMDAYLGSEDYLYRTLQPTGLIYGYPSGFPDLIIRSTKNWSTKTYTRVLLAESYFNVGLYHLLDPGKDPEAVSQEIASDIRAFSLAVQPRHDQQGRTVLGARRQPLDQLEYIFENRVLIRNDWRNFWTSFFHNSLVFLDLILFNHWMNDRSEEALTLMRDYRQKLRMSVLQVIAASAWADGEINAEERELFYYFKESADLPERIRKTAEQYLTTEVTLDQLDLGQVSTWLQQKYLLELAILTTLSHQLKTRVETEFLSQLTAKLGLAQTELDQSLVVIEEFVAKNRGQLHYLQGRQAYQQVSNMLLFQMRQELRKNQKRIQREIRESKELVHLLTKSTREELSPEEWERVRRQLLDVLRTVPAFTIFILPGGSVTLPILLKLFPKSWLFPSSFGLDEEDLDAELAGNK